MMTMRALCLAGALTVGLTSGAMAQSFGVYTPFGGVGIHGPASTYYDHDRWAYERPYRGYRYSRWASDAYAYEPGVEVYAPRYVAPRSNLHWSNPHANSNPRRGWSEPARDWYRSEMGFNSY